MPCDCSLRIKNTIHEEVGNAFDRKPSGGSKDLGHFLSISGRMYSCRHLAEHSVNIVLRPLIYLVRGVAYLFFYFPRECWNTKGCDDATCSIMLHSFALVIITPFCEAFQIVQATIGILNPEAYYNINGQGDDDRNWCGVKYKFILRTSFGDEAEHATNRHQSPPEDNYSRFDSCYGRIHCVKKIFVHAVSIVLLPVAYLVQSVTEFIFVAPHYFFNYSCSTFYFERSFSIFGCAVISPFGETVLLVKAVVGVIHPGAYYTENREILHTMNSSARLTLDGGPNQRITPPGSDPASTPSNSSDGGSLRNVNRIATSQS